MQFIISDIRENRLREGHAFLMGAKQNYMHVRTVKHCDFQKIKNALVKSVYYITPTRNLFLHALINVTTSNMCYLHTNKNKGVAVSWSAHKHNLPPNLIDRFILNLELEYLHKNLQA
jgi:hypothetical protein